MKGLSRKQLTRRLFFRLYCYSRDSFTLINFIVFTWNEHKISLIETILCVKGEYQMAPESEEHMKIKKFVLDKLRKMYGSGLKEYPDEGTITDIMAVTSDGISIFVENVWTSTKSNFQRDLNILHRSNANVKIFIINPEILSKKSLEREFEKTRMTEIKKGYHVYKMIDGSRRLNDPQFVEINFCKIVEELVSDARINIRTRESVRIARKKHLDELKEKVLNPMLTVLDSYSDTLKYTFNDFPEKFKSIRPTQSKLFDVSDKHFPELMKNWRTLEDELINHCRKCEFLYENIRKKLVKETGLSVHHTFNPRKQPFISESFQKLLWRSMFNKSLSENAVSGLHVKKSDYADAKEAYVLYWGGTTYAIGGNEEMKKCKVSFKQIAEQVNDEVQSLLGKKRKLSEKIERIDDTIRDLFELKSYSGNCLYCP